MIMRIVEDHNRIRVILKELTMNMVITTTGRVNPSPEAINKTMIGTVKIIAVPTLIAQILAITSFRNHLVVSI